MIEIKNLVKRYDYIKVLDSINLTLPDYGLIAIIGPSGCGKSTLLHIIGGLDKKYQGTVLVDKKPISRFLKKKSIGFLFQSFHLITWLTAYHNIQLPLYYRHYKYLIEEDKIHIKQTYSQKIEELSLGQRQRIAFLRTMIFNPRILLCDEPTASLDEFHSIEIMKILKEESKKRLVIFVSHNLKLVEEYSDEIYVLKDGVINNHKIINRVSCNEEIKMKRSIKRPKMELSLFSMKSNKKRIYQLSIALILSFTSILLSSALSTGFHQQLNLYVESMIPDSSISFRLKDHSSMSPEDFINETFIKHIHYYPEEYELLGIGEIADRYNKGDCIDIYDDSGFVEQSDLLCGRLMKNDNEIVISKKSAKRLVEGTNIEEIVNKDVMIWFKYRNEVKGKPVRIVGISQNNQIESIYYDNHFHLIKDIHKVDNIKTYYGIMYVDDMKNIEVLSDQYRLYEFKEVGKNTYNQIDTFMSKANLVLLLFTMFAVISSLFLIGEVMFLEVMMKRKELAIMKCFGARKIDLVFFILCQFIFIFIINVTISIGLFFVLSSLLNRMFMQELLVNINLIVMDYRTIIKIVTMGFVLCIVTMFIPIIYILNINTIESLKIKS